MKKVEFENVQNIIANQLKKGAFLNTKVDGKSNTMTIAWGNSGRMWDRDCFSVAVRHSRHTFDLMEQSQYFVVSIPKLNTLKKELVFCGTVSGKDKDKFEEANITQQILEEFDVPGIEECELNIVCKIAYKQSMEPSLILSDYVKKKYQTNDYHTIYYGEVVAVYEN